MEDYSGIEKDYQAECKKKYLFKGKVKSWVYIVKECSHSINPAKVYEGHNHKDTGNIG